MKANCFIKSVLGTVTIFIHGIVSQDAAVANLSNGDTGGVGSGLPPALGAAPSGGGVTPPMAPVPPPGLESDLPLDRMGRDASGDQDVELSFQDIPEFVSSNNTQRVEQGQNATLSCQVNKLSKYQMIWSRRNKESDIDWKVLRVGQTSILIKRDDPRFQFEDGSTVLRISNVQREDEGLYKCEIAVKDPPRIYVELIVTPPGGMADNPARTWTNDAPASLSPNLIPLIATLLFLQLLNF